MVDRVYRSDLPRLHQAFSELRREFSRLDLSTDWVRLRIDPLLRHVRRLEQLVPRLESSSLRGGVRLLHSDLVYLRQNLQGLKELLASERTRSRRSR